MKKLAYIMIVLIGMCFMACSNKDEFRIDGKVENAGELKKVMLYEGETLIDSAFLNEDKAFRFRRTAIEPRFYTLEIGSNYYFLAAQNGDKIEFETDLSKGPQLYSISGSPLSEKIKTFSEIQHRYMVKAAAVAKQFEEETQSSKPEEMEVIRQTLLTEYQQIMNEGSEKVLDFAQKNKDNLAGFFAMMSLDPAQYEQALMAYADEIRNKFPNNSSVQTFVNHMAELKPLSVGQTAPDFESTDINGKAVKLSDFRGKYTLLDFWASWCGPCREENPNIVEQYQVFKDKGFTVLGVSLDNSREAWLKGIREDKLTWTHVSDLQRWNSQAAQLYKINAIPASFLIGPDGIILAKNLRGDALEAFLSKHLNP